MKKIMTILITLLSLALIIYIGKPAAFSKIYSSHPMIEVAENEPIEGNDISMRFFKNEGEYSEYVLQNDILIADSFNIDLEDYILEEDFLNDDNIRSNRIFFVNKYIKEKYLDTGDMKPSVYSKKKDPNHVIILLQKKDKSCMMFQADLSIDFDIDNAYDGIVDMNTAIYE